jgi:hypothetical protein
MQIGLSLVVPFNALAEYMSEPIWTLIHPHAAIALHVYPWVHRPMRYKLSIHFVMSLFARCPRAIGDAHHGVGSQLTGNRWTLALPRPKNFFRRPPAHSAMV